MEPIATFHVGHFAEGGGEHYVTLDLHSPNIANFSITTDDDNIANTVDLNIASGDDDKHDAVNLKVTADETVDLDIIVDEAVDLNVAAHGKLGLIVAAFPDVLNISHNNSLRKYRKRFFVMQFLNQTIHGPVIDAN